jgi:farnesol dehydrogenase
VKVFVTGGSGYLGSAVVERLIARGAAVRCLLRGEPRRLPWAERVELLRGDVTDRDALRRGVAGADAVLHMAACVKTWVRDRNLFDRVNVDALDALFAEARAAGVRRVLYTSSFIALGPSDGRVGDETTVHPGDRYRNDYERTKALGLARARAEAAAGLPLVILIPGVVYGPGALTDGNHVAKIAADFLDRKLPGIPGGGDRLWTYSFVDDVADGHLLALDRGRDGETYALGGEDADLRGLLALLAAVSGVPAPRLRMPLWLVSAMARAEVALANVTGRTPQLTPGVVEIYDHEWRISSEKARRELAYATTPLREGLARTVAWLRARRAAMENG